MPDEVSDPTWLRKLVRLAQPEIREEIRDLERQIPEADPRGRVELSAAATVHRQLLGDEATRVVARGAGNAAVDRDSFRAVDNRPSCGKKVDKRSMKGSDREGICSVSMACIMFVFSFGMSFVAMGVSDGVSRQLISDERKIKDNPMIHVSQFGSHPSIVVASDAISDSNKIGLWNDECVSLCGNGAAADEAVNRRVTVDECDCEAVVSIAKSDIVICDVFGDGRAVLFDARLSACVGGAALELCQSDDCADGMENVDSLSFYEPNDLCEKVSIPLVHDMSHTRLVNE